MSVPASNRYTRSSPCPICGGWDAQARGEGKRCNGFYSDDREWARCSREEYSGALPVEDHGTYRHLLRGNCHCGQVHGAEVTSVRASARILEATYDYVDETGDLLYQVQRWSPKAFTQRRPNDTGRGDWVSNLNGVRRVLYRLTELLAADREASIYFVEGEKDAEACRRQGLVSTCNSGGTGGWRQSAAHAAEVLTGRDVVVWADKDDAGLKHAAAVAAALRGVARGVRVVQSPHSKDAHDHFIRGGTLEELVAVDDPPSSPRATVVKLVPPSDLPEIQVGIDLERMTDDACAALAGDTRVFQRGGVLSAVVTVPAEPVDSKKIKRAPDALVIRPLQKPTLHERMGSCARWMKQDKRSGEYKEAMPPQSVVGTVMARGEWPGIRTLMSVATSPVLRPDGSILQTPGYDPSTGILYRPVADYPEVAERPTIDDARGALEMLREVVCDFPFASPAHESAWLAGLLTMLARPAIDGPCPLFAIDATTRGTGKSRLVDAASKLALGHVAARCPLPDEDDEMRKRITTILLDSDPCVLFDNVTKAITLPSLDAMLTSETWKDRLLGLNASVTVPVRCVSWLTGNNIVLGGDLTRRTIHIRLESKLENPEERADFKHPDLLAWIGERRHIFVAAALTILRAHILSGHRSLSSPWGSFESWSRVVPPVLEWLGMPSPLAARATVGDVVDEEKQHLMVLVENLRRLCPDNGVTPLSARTIIQALYPDRDPHDAGLPPDGYNDLRDAIEAETSAKPGFKPDARRLGKWLTRVRGRFVSGWCVSRVDGPNHTALWRAAAG